MNGCARFVSITPAVVYAVRDHDDGNRVFVHNA
jgi:hypothetical protein